MLGGCRVHILRGDFQFFNDKNSIPSNFLFFINKKNSDICSGAAEYISSEEIFSFFNDKNSRPSNFLFQIARGSGATLIECTFSSKNAPHSKDLLKIGPLQDFTSKEPGPSMIHQAKPRKRGDLRVQL
jgi:hypothetical protein